MRLDSWPPLLTGLLTGLPWGCVFGSVGHGPARGAMPPVITELMADNETTIEAPSGGWPDWIELHNPNEFPLSLEGWTVTDALTEPGRHVLGGLSIDADGTLLLWADGAPERGPDHLSFALDAEGEAFGLYAPDGRAVDGLRFGPQAPDVSLLRSADGWTLLRPATPGER